MKKTKLTNIGEQYNRWTILSNPFAIKKNNRNKYFVKCKCNCGTIQNVLETSVKKGSSKSCGCLQKEKAASLKTTHGMHSTHTYQCWVSMKSRCNNANEAQYKDYGGRGISYDKSWESFEQFYADMGNSNNLTLERINPNKNYSKDNCKWANNIEQARNKTTSNCKINEKLLRLTIDLLNAKTLTYKEIANKLSISPNLVGQIAFANNIYPKLKKIKS